MLNILTLIFTTALLTNAAYTVKQDESIVLNDEPNAVEPSAMPHIGVAEPKVYIQHHDFDEEKVGMDFGIPVTFTPTLEGASYQLTGFQDPDGSYVVSATTIESAMLAARPHYEKRDIFGQSWIEEVTTDTVTQDNIYGDLTHTPDNIKLVKTVHCIHNNGYKHCATEQTYDNVTLWFNKGQGCVTLSGPSQMDSTASGFFNFFGGTPAHLSHQHDGGTDKNNPLRSVQISENPTQNTERRGVIDGSISFGPNFAFALSVKDLTVKLCFDSKVTVYDHVHKG